MTDIFISYKREERHVARPLAAALEKQGWNVWWDRELQPGAHIHDEIWAALQQSKCVIVLWSRLSVEANYVKAEATSAWNQNKLVPVAIDDVEIPFPFKDIHTEQLSGWDGSEVSPAFARIVSGAARLLGPPPSKAKEQGKPETASEESASVPRAIRPAGSGDARDKEPLKTALKNSGSDHFRDRKVAANLFGQVVGAESINGLFTLLQDPNEIVAKEARQVLLRPDYVKDLVDADIGFVVAAAEQRDKGAISELEFLRLLPVSDTKEIRDHALRGIRAKDAEARSAAASILGRIGNPIAVEFLRDLLEDPDQAVVTATKTALIRLADEQTVDQVITAAEYEALSDALKNPAPKLVGLLCDKLADSPKHIEPIIGQSREAHCVDKFVDILLARLDHDDERIRREAIFLLWRVGDARAVDPLVSLLADTSLSAELHKEVIEALGRIGDDRAVTPLVDELRHAERDVSWEGRKLTDTIIFTLGLIGDARAVDPILQYLKTANQREQAVWSLGKIGDPRAIDAIARAVSTTDTRCIKPMITALVEIGGPRAVDALLNHLQADWSRERPENVSWYYKIFVEGLGRMGDPRAVEALAPLLQNQDPDVRAATIEALAQIGGQRAIDTLVAQLEIAEAKDKTAISKALRETRRKTKKTAGKED